jgi:DNA invertase Pin-like site-specific DNA recombinase
MNLLPPPSTLPPGSTVWAYLRDSGGEKQDRSIPRQLEAIIAWCKERQLMLVRVFKDEAKSGTTTAGRDDFHRMIAQSKEIESNPHGLLLWNFARFARELDDSQYYKSFLRRNGLIIHSLTDPIPEGPYARFVETLIDISNEERSRQTGIDAKDGLRSIVSQGAVPGTPPRGFKRVPLFTVNARTGEERKNHKWVPDKKLIHQVRKAFEMRAKGSTLFEIHKSTRLYSSLNSYRTFFTNPIYIGILEFGDMVIEKYCDPIIDMSTWNAVQAKIKATSQTRFGASHPKRVTSIYLLSGIIRCARCSAPMNGNTTTRPALHGRDEGYRCSRAKRRRDCDAGRISRRKIEDLVLSTLTDYILTPENLTAIQEIAIKNQTTGETQRAERKSALSDERGELSRQIANITKAIADSGHSDALLDALKQKESMRAQVKAEIEGLLVPIQTIPHLSTPEIETVSQALVEHLNHSPIEQRRQLLRGIVHDIIAERDGKHIRAFITYYYPPPFDLIPTLSKSPDPVGAHLYRQLFTYPVESKPPGSK